MGKFTGILLASDVDGTLLPFHGEVSRRAQDAIRYFISEGGHFALATGRTLLSMQKHLHQIPVNAPVVLGNGAFCYDYDKQELLYDQPLEGDYLTFLRLVEREFPTVAIEAHAANGMWIYRPNAQTDMHLGLIGDVAETVDSLEALPDRFLKAVFVGDVGTLQQIKHRLIDQIKGRYTMVSAIDFFLEFLDIRANKGNGVARLEALLGAAKTYVVGDNNNDLPMLTRFEGFVPAGGSEDAKQAASHLVCSVEDGALADVIEWLDKKYADGPLPS